MNRKYYEQNYGRAEAFVGKAFWEGNGKAMNGVT